MNYLILSDIHIDTHIPYVIEPSILKRFTEFTSQIIFDTMDYIWKTYNVPTTEAIIIAGDLCNDFNTFTHTIHWLANKYKKVYFVPGNHDLVVRGATYSKSNLQFKTSEEKLVKMQEECNKYTNVHFLNGDIVDGIAGCIGMNDFKCEPNNFFPLLNRWNNWFDGEHWKYMNNNPLDIWNYYDKIMTNLCEQKPKIMVTHFALYQVGVNHKFKNSKLNEMFYFNAEKYLDMMENDTYWICGHIHDKKNITYYNNKGNKIIVLCNPLGYPNEADNSCDMMIYPKDNNKKIKRKNIYLKNWNDYIIGLTNK